MLNDKPDHSVLDKVLEIFNSGSGAEGGAMRLIRTFRALLVDGSNNFDTYSKMQPKSNQKKLH